MFEYILNRPRFANKTIFNYANVKYYIFLRLSMLWMQKRNRFGKLELVKDFQSAENGKKKRGR